MRPFSAFTYIRSNKMRSLVLVMMMSFITACFIGGMYVYNPLEIFEVSWEDSNRFLLVTTRGSSNDAIDEYHQMQRELSDNLPATAQEIIHVNFCYVSYDSLMQYNCTTECLCFQSEEQFELFRERTHLIPDDVVLHDGEYAFSELLANNKGLKVGDYINNSELKLGAIFDKPGMRAFRLKDDEGTDCTLILGNDGNCSQQLHEDLENLSHTLSKKYPHLYVYTPSTLMEDVREQSAFMFYIFGAIILVLAVVLLVTINAAFTAAYDKRKHEFAIYKAIGFTKWQIFKKIASEVLILNTAAIVLGAIVNGAVILVLNQVLWSSGQHFYQINGEAVTGTVITEVLIVSLIILMNWRKVRKCEVTEE